MEDCDDFKNLELISTIGFNGHVVDGLIIHTDREHMIYPVGCQIVIRNLNTAKQEFLRGHENNISCIAMSHSGQYLASGQVTYMGFRAPIIIWDYERRALLHKMTLHKVKVQSLAFSPSDCYLATCGGQDDCSMVVWNVQTGKAVCGAESALKQAGNVNVVKFSNNSDDKFYSGGDQNLRSWTIDAKNHKIKGEDFNFGATRRVVNCIEVEPDDDYFYCGTTTGDVAKMNTKTLKLTNLGPAKRTAKFTLGITALKILKTGDLLIGTGAGKVCVLKSNCADKYPIVKQLQADVEGEVTSISLRGEGHQFFTGTRNGHINRFNLIEFTQTPIITAPSTSVCDVAFPSLSSQLFATCSGHEIRIWHATTSRELLRINVPGMTCNCLLFTSDGQSLVSGWEDGKIRVFLPESGKPFYTINNAHHVGVTALALTEDSNRIISGGGEGQVRVWDLTYQPLAQKFAASMKEHTTKITCIKLTRDNRECVSASADGTCIIWDLVTFKRKQMVLCQTMFRCVCYHPQLPQIVTAGTDRKVSYWETIDGAQIRELEASKSGSINGVDLTGSGKVMVTGGDDRLVKVWNYADGNVTHVGIGHSGNILAVRICPNLQYIVTVSQDGAVLIWKFPMEAEGED